MSSSHPLDRAALYYPYIHIPRNKIDWLKATLLCFPQVRRMVPDGFQPDDPPEIREFHLAQNGYKKPLFDSEYLTIREAKTAPALAQERLLRKLREHETEIADRFTDSTGAWQPYRVHRDKIHYDLWEYLISNGLAGVGPGAKGDHWPDWLYIHPALGDTILGTIAVAVATAKGCDIVTSDGQIHNALATQDENQIFNALLNLEQPVFDPEDSEKVDWLAQAVIQTRFNVSELTVSDIAELHKEGKTLMSFKRALAPIAAEIPNIQDPEERKLVLQRKADEVIDAWEKYKKTLPGFALAALVEAQETKPPEYALSMIATGTAAWMPVLGIGLAIGVLTYKGYKIVQRFREGSANPFNFLSQIEDRGATLLAVAADR